MDSTLIPGKFFRCRFAEFRDLICHQYHPAGTQCPAGIPDAVKSFADAVVCRKILFIPVNFAENKKHAALRMQIKAVKINFFLKCGDIGVRQLLLPVRI